jgi:hypothetical protein
VAILCEIASWPDGARLVRAYSTSGYPPTALSLVYLRPGQSLERLSADLDMDSPGHEAEYLMLWGNGAFESDEADVTDFGGFWEGSLERHKQLWPRFRWVLFSLVPDLTQRWVSESWIRQFEIPRILPDGLEEALGQVTRLEDLGLGRGSVHEELVRRMGEDKGLLKPYLQHELLDAIGRKLESAIANTTVGVTGYDRDHVFPPLLHLSIDMGGSHPSWPSRGNIYTLSLGARSSENTGSGWENEGMLKASRPAQWIADHDWIPWAVFDDDDMVIGVGETAIEALRMPSYLIRSDELEQRLLLNTEPGELAVDQRPEIWQLLGDLPPCLWGPDRFADYVESR